MGMQALHKGISYHLNSLITVLQGSLHYIIHLNIALEMLVSLYFGGKSHVSNGQYVSFKEPCLTWTVWWTCSEPPQRELGLGLSTT